MTKQFLAFAAPAILAMALAVLFTPAVFAIADLTDWTGENNAPPDPEAENNNYALIGTAPQTSAGGAFQARRDRPSGGATPRNNAWLSDATLAGSLLGTEFQYGFQEDLMMKGTITFANPNNADPNWFFGFYNSGIDPSSQNGIDRIGLAFGDSSAGFFRVQANARNSGTTAVTIAASLTVDGTAGGAAPLASGTYPFEFKWTAATKTFDASIGSGDDRRTRVLTPDTTPSTTNLVNADVFDHFGFFQFGETVANPPPPANLLTFNVTVSNIDYTSDTDIPIAAVDGDYNGDGEVDAADYVVWRNGGPLLNEVDNPGTVNQQDYVEWRSRFGNPPGSGGGLGGAAVPEPSTVLLVALVVGLCGAVRRRPSKNAPVTN